MPAPCTPDSYRPYVNENFTVTDRDGRSRTFRLDEVKNEIEDEVQLCFSLLFSADGEVLPQGQYAVQHAQMGEFTLFLVPIRRKRSGLGYEAVFNLLKEEAQ